MRIDDVVRYLMRHRINAVPELFFISRDLGRPSYSSSRKRRAPI